MTGNTLGTITSIITVLKEVKDISDQVPINWFLPPNRGKLKKLQDKIRDLENIINTGFPKLSRLIIFYSQLISDVRIAGALSDKLAELYELSPGIETYTTVLINDLNGEYSRIDRQLSQFSNLDVAEKGSLFRISTEIRDQIEILKRTPSNSNDRINEILKNISKQYSDMSSTLSKLLEKILVEFDIS